MHSVSLTTQSQRKVCHLLRLSCAIRSARQNHVSPPPEGRFDTNLQLHSVILRFTILYDLCCVGDN